MILHIFHLGDGETREEVPMDIMNPQPAEREAERMQANREELVERIARAMREDGTAQPLPGLHLNRLSSPRAPIYGVMEPSVAVIAQGSKEVLLGDSRYRRAAHHPPGAGSLKGAALPQSAPGTGPQPRR